MNIFYEFEAAWGIFELINVGLIAIISLILIYIFSKHRKDKAPLFVWAINLKKSRNQVEILLTATLISLFVFSLYVVGEFLSLLSIVIISQLIGIISYLMVSYVIIIWFKEFRRFV
jgi:hypothetical protein